MSLDKILNFEVVLEEIKQETDNAMLNELYCLHDGYAFLITADDKQKKQIRAMIEEFPTKDLKEEKTDRIAFGIHIKQGESRHAFFSGIYEKLSGEEDTSNCFISFHADGGNQGLQTKAAVIPIAEKLMELRIPFVTYHPPSKYSPRN